MPDRRGRAPGLELRSRAERAEKTANAKGKTAGFWMGIWHGLISPITFVISLFSRSVRLYEIHNNGSWYNFGFVIGAGLFLSGGILGRKNRDRRR